MLLRLRTLKYLGPGLNLDEIGLAEPETFVRAARSHPSLLIGAVQAWCNADRRSGGTKVSLSLHLSLALSSSGERVVGGT